MVKIQTMTITNAGEDVEHRKSNSLLAEILNGTAFIPIPKKGNAKQCSNYCTTALILHASKVISAENLQTSFQQYMNWELPDVQANPAHWKRPWFLTDWGQEEKGAKENEMIGWDQQLNGHEFVQTPGESEGQGSLKGCSPWGHKESDMTEQVNNNDS